MAGTGIDDNIEWAYEAIAHNYVPDDDIFLFGFSRGAFTVRSLASFLFHIGIIHKDDLDKFPAAYHRYQTLSRDPNDPSKLIGLEDIRRFVERTLRPVPIRFLGVWDTVAALGAEEGAHDIDLTPNITHAYQALALHEFRSDFWPELWTKKASKEQIVEQVWFPGAHSDIGGGLKETGLSAWPFVWMVERAASADLEFDLSYVSRILADENVLAPMQIPDWWWGKRRHPFDDRPIYSGIEEFRHETVSYRRHHASPLNYGAGSDWDHARKKWRFEERIGKAHALVDKLPGAPEHKAESQHVYDIQAQLSGRRRH
jgi:hypothetical protein